MKTKSNVLQVMSIVPFLSSFITLIITGIATTVVYVTLFSKESLSQYEVLVLMSPAIILTSITLAVLLLTRRSYTYAGSYEYLISCNKAVNNYIMSKSDHKETVTITYDAFDYFWTEKEIVTNLGILTVDFYISFKNNGEDNVSLVQSIYEAGQTDCKKFFKQHLRNVYIDTDYIKEMLSDSFSENYKKISAYVEDQLTKHLLSQSGLQGITVYIEKREVRIEKRGAEIGLVVK